MTCEWFALCVRPAAGTVAHPILGAVPCCTECAARFGLEVQPLNPVYRAARLVLARAAWDEALMAGDLAKADRCAAEVAALEAGASPA